MATRQRSRQTHRTYAAVYRSLLGFLGEHATVEDLTPEAVRAYRDALEHADRTPATIAKHLSAIRSLAATVGADADVRTDVVWVTVSYARRDRTRVVPLDDALKPIVVTVCLILSLFVASAARATPPPTSKQAVEPARNAAAFDAPPWDSVTIAATAKAGQDPDAKVTARPVKATGGPAATSDVRSAQRGRGRQAHAAHSGLVICWATPTMARLGLLISAEGYSACSNGPADLLGNKNCVDLWSTGGYWTTLSCGDWRTCGLCSYIAGDFHPRYCTLGRYYRPTGKMSAVHGNAISGSYPGNYIQC